MKTKKCLLIIDMQKGSFTDDTPRHLADYVVSRINAIADLFRENGLPVIFVQHDGTQFNEYVPNTRDWELLDALNLKDTDILMTKTANDTFYKTELEAVLRSLDVTDLVITGCATDFCLDSTIQSGLVKDYNIMVVKDGHTTADRPHLSAEKIIEHYNWVWGNLNPTQGKIEVRDSESIIDLLTRPV